MTIYYVDGAVGNDANAGTSEGAGNAWATIDKAMNTVAAGDTVYVKASVTYNENGNIDTAGTLSAPIDFIGYSSTTTDNGKVTWTNSAGSALTNTPSGAVYTFSNFKFNGCSSDGVVVGSYYKFINCEFTNNTGDGCDINGAQCSFYKCIFHTNSVYGLDYSTSNNIVILGCLFYANTQKAIDGIGAGGLLYKSVFYANGTAGYDTCGIVSDGFCIVGCTVDGDGTTGDLIAGGTESLGCLVDCILYDGDKAYSSADTSGPGTFYGIYSNNLLNGNTQNAYWIGTGAWSAPGYGIGDVTSAPAFTDEANDDYTLGASSPAIDAGLQPGGIT